MGKSAAQKRATEQVNQRLTESTPIRLDTESVVSGKSGGAKDATTKNINEIHPSLASTTQRMEDENVAAGVVTTADGLQVRIAKNNKYKAAGYQPQSLETSETPRKGVAPQPPLQEGVSQKFHQRIGRAHGPEKAAELTAEADAVAARPNPLRSDGLISNIVGQLTPSMGGNRLSMGGSLSALAKDPTKKMGEHQALRRLGYTDEVQTKLLGAARDRIARSQQGRAPGIPALTESEVAARAYAQVTEHLDEALHGTKSGRLEQRDLAVAAQGDVNAQQGSSIKEGSPEEGAALPVAEPKGPRLGMSQRRTPEQQAARAAVRGMVRQKGGWGAINKEALAEASKNDLEEVTLRQEARRALAVSAEDRDTMSPGANPEQKARSRAQPVFSTGPATPFADTSPGLGVGIPSEEAVARGKKAAKIRKGEKVTASNPAKVSAPGPAQAGEVSPIPTDLPTEPARLGRTRAERGVRGSTAPWAPKDNGVAKTYGDEIAAYEASRPKVTPKTQSPRSEATAVPAAASNVAVAQTATPVPKTQSIAEKRAAQRARL